MSAKQKPERIWMLVTSDKYRLPMAVADSIEELAELVGVKVNTIVSAVSHAKKKGRNCRYIAVEI
jgi:hypothetical protein